MTKQNRIHKLLVLRQKGRKEVLRFLSRIPTSYNDEEYHRFVRRKRTYMKAFFKRYKNYDGS